MKFHLPLNLRRALLSLLLPVAGTFLSSANNFEDYTDALSFSNSSRHFEDVSLTFLNNEDIEFLNNTTIAPPSYGVSGGAILARSDNKLTFQNNNNISFQYNSAIPDTGYTSSGGAIFTWGELTFDGNNQIIFTNNQASEAGAIRATKLSIANTSETVCFENNYATDGDGGSLNIHYTGDAFLFDISGNTKVVFQNNTATGNGGAILLHGLGNSNQIPVFQKNGVLSFINNSSGNNGGAIGNNGNDRIIFQENDTISFEDNTSKGEGEPYAPTQA